MIAAGIGLRPGAAAEEIAALVGRAALCSGRAPSVLAVPPFRDGEPGPRVAAVLLSLELRVVAADALEAVQGRCRTRSALAEALVGVASVAEGCALAGAGPGSRLLFPRIASANVTCALAESAGPP